MVLQQDRRAVSAVEAGIADIAVVVEHEAPRADPVSGNAADERVGAGEVRVEVDARAWTGLAEDGRKKDGRDYSRPSVFATK